MKKTVTNNLPNSAVTVAYATIPPKESRDILAKDLDKWLAKGGQRLVDSKKISISEAGAAVSFVDKPKPVVVAEDEPAKDETVVNRGPDEGLTFDGKPASEASPEKPEGESTEESEGEQTEGKPADEPEAGAEKASDKPAEKQGRGKRNK